MHSAKSTYGVFALLLMCFAATCVAQPLRILDNFESLGTWQAEHTDDVRATLSKQQSADGTALHLDFDFTDARGVPINGYATARRALPLDLSENYEFRFRVRGSSSVNSFQFKLVDASGENVWWLNQPDFEFTPQWRELRIKRRQIAFAWGPTKDHVLRHAAAIEFVVSSGRDGGKGWIEIDHLSLRRLPTPTPPPKPRVTASAAVTGFPAAAALDGDPKTAWRVDASKPQHLDIDFGRLREFSALIAHWRPGETGMAIYESSEDGKHWGSFGGVTVRTADGDAMLLEEYETRYLRVMLRGGGSGTYALSELEIEDIDWAPNRNAFFAQLAKRAPPGSYPRGFSEQPYWTIVGIPGGVAPALVSEDGAIEPRKGGYSIEPFLRVGGRDLSWAEASSTQQLRGNYLPMPAVIWHTPQVELEIDTFARGTRDAAQLVARYRLRNRTDTEIAGTLQLAIRPFQVDPPAQFLNSPGGVAAIQSVNWDGHQVDVDGRPEILPLRAPDDFLFEAVVPAGALDAARRPLPCNKQHCGIYDEFGLVAGALVYKFSLAPHAQWETGIIAANAGALPVLAFDANDPSTWAAREQARVADAWHARLDRVHLRLPPSAQYLADALRSAHAQILMSREGPALRPGTRSYARSWIRDGAMIADALLRLGDIDAVRDYADWYAPHQFSDGKVPCCVDHRGADPVPENDSEGELIHLIAQLYRYGGDRAELQRHWPQIAAAIAYMDRMRATETGAKDAAFRALMPASISHEGYSAKPMHSYWDDFWALTGYSDAADMAAVLNAPDAADYARTRDAFRVALFASIGLAVKTHAIDFIPGCVELGDFDATSTTIALSPANDRQDLPEDLLRNTFERYWHEFAARADGSKPWQDYTPYEWRTVGAFVRLGWRARAQAAIKFLFDTGARPAGWNQWAEVVGHDPRKIRFIGDMPHAWVASDFIRSALDLFAYERAGDRSLVLAAGVAPEWIAAPGGIGIDGLRSAYGSLSYRLRRAGDRLTLHIDAGAKPPGGFVLPWPFESSPGATRINGKPASWKNDGLHIVAAPADVAVDVAVNNPP